MRKNAGAIPVNYMANEYGTGISIEKLSFDDFRTADKATLSIIEEGNQFHRHDGHSFFLLERGSICVEIDFQKHTITAPAIMYVHPDQVHRTLLSENMTVSALAITNENLNPEYLELLEHLTPANPLLLDREIFSIISEMVSLCIKFAEKKNNKLHHSLLKDSCNTLVALVLSQYLASARSTDKISRYENVTKSFRKLLERNFTLLKRPAEYAGKLNISAPYLNECVKNTTGFAVSHHIQQRVILQAKRLLIYSRKSVKEIAAELGYDDYPYFSRLFTKITGETALNFRKKTSISPMHALYCYLIFPLYSVSLCC